MGRSKAAMVAPARLSAVPNLTRPEMVKVCGGPDRRTRTWSPTLKWYFWAVPSSITTWFGVVGAVPWARCSDDSCELGSKDRPNVGRPSRADGLAVGGDELGVAA